MESYKKLGCRVVVIASGHLQNRAWPMDIIDEIHYVKSLEGDMKEILHAISYLARDRKFDIIAPMEEYMMQPAATIRAHLGCVGGMDEGIARRVRDKLNMRQAARAAGLHTPRFVGLSHHPAVSDFLEEVPAPWILKPRLEGGSVQMKKFHSPGDVWQQIHEMGDKQSWFLLEEFITGDVCHVDSLYHRGKVTFANASQYLTPPFSVWHGGGVFGSRSVGRTSKLGKTLLKENERAVKAMGVMNGVAHTEFIVDKTGKPYFLELGARIPGAHLDILVERASGVNIAFEQCRLEICALDDSDYEKPKPKFEPAGIVLCLSKDKHPDLSQFDAPEVIWRLAEDHHAGLIFRGKQNRVEELLHDYAGRLQNEYLAVLPPSDKPG